MGPPRDHGGMERDAGPVVRLGRPVLVIFLYDDVSRLTEANAKDEGGGVLRSCGALVAEAKAATGGRFSAARFQRGAAPELV